MDSDGLFHSLYNDSRSVVGGRELHSWGDDHVQGSVRVAVVYTACDWRLEPFVQGT